MRKRSNRIEVRFTNEELSDLIKKSKKSRLSVGGFVRAAVRGTEIKEAPPADLPVLIQELRRVGCSLDLLLKLANDAGLPAVAYQLRGALERNRAVEKLIVDIYTTSC